LWAWHFLIEPCTAQVHGMSHEIAKLLLEHAETFLERTEAIKAASSLGMPLNEIQDYLDWLDSLRTPAPGAAPAKRRTRNETETIRPASASGDEGVRPTK
jgi:DNA-binding transcriptional MerR regulator